MAEIQGGGDDKKKKGGKVRSKKSSTRIDMTPMVDLAFLLLTFFVMTTTLNKPQTMEITMPEKPKKDDPEPPKVNERDVLTIVLGENDKVYWYSGITDPKIELTNFSATGIRKVLRTKKSEIPKLVVLIKPSDKSKYKNMVDILDEMNIGVIQRYAMVDITPTDEELIKDSQL
jgi:biopolymer transport protein ExbD